MEHQKQPPKGVLKKRCSENMQRIYGENPCPSVISIKLLCFATLLKSQIGMGVSCKFVVYFQNTFSEEHLWVAASGSCRVSPLKLKLLYLKL